MSDRCKTEEITIIRDAADASFAELAREHDRLVDLSVKLHQKAQGRGTDHLEALHTGRLADVIKMIMLVRFPEASDDWFA